MICNTSAVHTKNLERGSLGWKPQAEARVTWVTRDYGGKVGSAVAGRLRVAASQAAEMQRWRSGDDKMRFPWRARPCWGAHQCKSCRAGGGGRWRRVIKSKVNAGWARSVSRRVAV